MSGAATANTQYGTLSANADAFVEVPAPNDVVEVVNRNGAGEIFFTVDGSVPTVGAANTWMVPAAAGSSLQVPSTFKPSGLVPVNLISGAATTYGVTGMSA
jgi:hypothetical protein